MTAAEKEKQKRTYLAEEEDLDRRFSAVSDLGNALFKQNTEKIFSEAIHTISKFGPKVDAAEFFIIGSWPAALVAKFCSTVTDPVELVSNDIDVFKRETQLV